MNIKCLLGFHEYGGIRKFQYLTGIIKELTCKRCGKVIRKNNEK